METTWDRSQQLGTVLVLVLVLVTTATPSKSFMRTKVHPVPQRIFGEHITLTPKYWISCTCFVGWYVWEQLDNLRISPLELSVE